MTGLVLSRRQLLLAAAACGLVGATSCSRIGGGAGGTAAEAGSAIAGGAPGAGTGAVLPDGVLLARRFSFAPTPELVALAKGDGSAFFDHQLDPTLAEDPNVAALLDAGDGIHHSEVEGDSRDGPSRRRAALQSLFGSTLAGAAWSTGQLRRIMADFWADHLHVSSTVMPELLLLPAYDREVIVAGALGRFDDLLVASARSAAMLVSLDNATSRADRGRTPNENYARELMELQTLGLAPGTERAYDEDDVQAVAHVLSGWSLERRSHRFVFRPEWHDLGPASSADIVGWTPSGTGERDGEDLLRHLAAHRSTARFISWKLARRFVSDDVAPDDDLVERLAEVYRSHDTEIGPVLREIGSSEELTSSPAAKIRRPLDLVVAMLRTSTLVPDAATWTAAAPVITKLLRNMGQLPYGWPAPDGYPEPAPAWSGAGALIARWNTAAAAADGFGRLAIRDDVHAASGSALIRALTASDGSSGLADEVDRAADPTFARALVFASPEFQLR